MLNDQTLDEICDNVEKSIDNFLADQKPAFSDREGMQEFLSSQYDMRLDNLLQKKTQ